MFRQRILPCSVNFFKELIFRKPYKELEEELHINNELKRFVGRIPMIGLGVGGMIGK
jgi:hypothetical protein